MTTKSKVALVLLPLITAAVVLLGSAHPAYSFLPAFASQGNPVRWSMSSFPVQYNINPSVGSNISTAGGSAPSVIVAAFNTWLAAPNASINITQGPPTNLTTPPSAPYSVNLICFVCTDADFTKDASTLAVTLFTFATGSGQSDGHGGTTQFAGQMENANIFFNPADSFTTDPAAANVSVTDLQTVATHEIGHFLGLDHSGVINAVMFPFSPSVRQSLAYDDVAGISPLYPGSTTVGTGTFQGHIVFQNGGAGVFGAHVFADSTTATQGYGSGVRKGPIGAMTDPSGAYSISGLPADTYTVTVEPLDGPVTNSDVSDYPKIFGKASVDTSFTTRQH